ncbi:MAG: endonuclease/exonuclease/phosphatase family protein [Planctomycetota bacterium]
MISRDCWQSHLNVISLAASVGRCASAVLLAFLATLGTTSTVIADETVRIATFNVSLFGKSEGDILRRLADPRDSQAKKIASIVQSVRPDVLLINELDYDPDGETANRLATNFFARSQDGLDPIDYLYMLAFPSNTGIATGQDLNGNGKMDDPQDAFGYGLFPGQYGMAIFSRYPIQVKAVRTFQEYLWKDLPNALRPVHPVTGESYYSDEAWQQFRLSSKNHVDVPIDLIGQTLHVLASHPTPPVFDGDEDHNGCRNHDEIRFWIDYLSDREAKHLKDDRGIIGGLKTGQAFVIMGDLNSDPVNGDSRQAAIRRLLAHPLVQDPEPRRGGLKIKQQHSNDERSVLTAKFGRVDYVLPSRNLQLEQSGVFWPYDPDSRVEASDHRMVWIDVRSPDQ